MGFGQPYRFDKIQPIAMSVPGVMLVEAWQEITGDILAADEKTSTQIEIIAPPNGSNLIKPAITSGRWLVPEDQNAIVIGNHLLAVRPELKVGDKVKLTLNDRVTDWEIVGTYRMAGNVIPPIVYTNSDYFSKLIGVTGQAYSIRVVTDQHDAVTEKRIGDALRAAFEASGIQVGNLVIGAELIQQNISSLSILIIFMLIAASFVGLVGGLGLMSTMSINVIERTREIGVMRAIGASNGSIYQLVLVEGILIGLISWFFGVLLAFPISILLDNAAGIAFLRSPLNFVFSWDGVLIWLAVSIIIAIIASLIPARSAAKMTVREILAYE
jgi:putative ABC transport system permease protein